MSNLDKIILTSKIDFTISNFLFCCVLVIYRLWVDRQKRYVAVLGWQNFKYEKKVKGQDVRKTNRTAERNPFGLYIYQTLYQGFSSLLFARHIRSNNTVNTALSTVSRVLSSKLLPKWSVTSTRLLHHLQHLHLFFFLAFL